MIVHVTIPEKDLKTAATRGGVKRTQAKTFSEEPHLASFEVASDGSSVPVSLDTVPVTSWIEAEKQKPADEEDVIIFPWNDDFAATFTGGKFMRGKKVLKPTHWLPIPEGPI